jgi:NADH-quinone oxidoreductase subunit K
MPIQGYLLLATALFSLGIYGLLTRRNAIGLLLSVELMANAVNINLVAFAHHHGGQLGQIFAIFAMAITVAEVVVGLALLILLYRSKKDVLVDSATELGG